MRNRIRPGIPFEPLPPWCGRHAGRRSDAVSACPSASVRVGRSRLSDQIGQRLRPCPPVRGQQHLPDQGNGPVDLDRTVYDLDRGAPGLGPPVRAPSPGSGMRSSTTSTPDLVPGQGELTLTELRPAWLPRFGCFGQTRPIGRVIAAKKAAKSAAKSAAHHAAKTTASGSKLAAVGGAKAAPTEGRLREGGTDHPAPPVTGRCPACTPARSVNGGRVVARNADVRRSRPLSGKLTSHAAERRSSRHARIASMNGCLLGRTRATRPFIGRVVGMCAGASVTRPCRFR